MVSKGRLPIKRILKEVERLLKTPSAQVTIQPMLFLELDDDFLGTRRYGLGQTQIIITGNAPRQRTKRRKRTRRQA